MAPPKPPETGPASAVLSRLQVLTKRADFVATSRASRVAKPGFVLQGRMRGDDAPARVGFTCSKKVGNAVARNRAKRRLREIARLTLTPLAQPGWDYVLIGRREVTATRNFAALQSDLEDALATLHGTLKATANHGSGR